MKNFFLKFTFVVFFLFTLSAFASEPTPAFYVKFNLDKELVFNAGDDENFSLEVTNIDENKKILLYFQSLLNGKQGWFSPINEFLILDPQSTDFFNFNLNIPSDACTGLYDGMIRMTLISFHDVNDGLCEFQEGMGVFTAVGHEIDLEVLAGYVCDTQGEVSGLVYDNSPIFSDYYSIDGGLTFNSMVCMDHIAVNVFTNIIYYDFNGDQIYESDDGDELIDMGTAYLYDASDNLISSTDLSFTKGGYSVPLTALSGIQDFYLVVETDKWDDGDSSIKDTLWEGNLFVDRKGTYSNQQNVYLMEDISDYSEITHNIDVRSRNTDQSGTWDAGTVTIGPDDKDQIISPIHWDQLVAGTDFPYVDLDHDGRIDPDDKDHVISPLYWDFPN